MKQKAKMSVETALRNIKSSMRAEGFEFSEGTRAACREILESGERAKSVADRYIYCKVYTRLICDRKPFPLEVL